jgi:GDPmannose 4,6-dehydratase
VRKVDIATIVADCSKLRARTGWQPEIAFEQSLHDVLDYWREQVRTGAGDPTPLGLRIQRDT